MRRHGDMDSLDSGAGPSVMFASASDGSDATAPRFNQFQVSVDAADADAGADAAFTGAQLEARRHRSRPTSAPAWRARGSGGGGGGGGAAGGAAAGGGGSAVGSGFSVAGSPVRLARARRGRRQHLPEPLHNAVPREFLGQWRMYVDKHRHTWPAGPGVSSGVKALVAGLADFALEFLGRRLVAVDHSVQRVARKHAKEAAAHAITNKRLAEAQTQVAELGRQLRDARTELKELPKLREQMSTANRAHRTMISKLTSTLEQEQRRARELHRDATNAVHEAQGLRTQVQALKVQAKSAAQKAQEAQEGSHHMVLDMKREIQINKREQGQSTQQVATQLTDARERADDVQEQFRRFREATALKQKKLEAGIVVVVCIFLYFVFCV